MSKVLEMTDEISPDVKKAAKEVNKVLEILVKSNEFVTEPIEDLEEARLINFYSAQKSIEEKMPHTVSEVICVNCLKRWISVRPVKTLLKDLECPNCGQIQSVVETGQILNPEDF